MKNRVITVGLVCFFLGGIARAGLQLETIKAADLQSDTPVLVRPIAVKAAPDLLNRFNSAADKLQVLNRDTSWLSTDLDRLERRAREIIYYHITDSFFESDMNMMSIDISRWARDISSLAKEVKDLLALAEKSADLNTAAIKIQKDSASILANAWPDMQDAAGRLQNTVESGDPRIIGYNAQWYARDITRNTDDFTYQARNLSKDAKMLELNTRP